MNYILPVFIALLGIFYYDTFGWLIGSWINNDYYSHGFLVPVISGYIIWSMRKGLAETEKKEFQGGLMLLVAGILLKVIAMMWTIRFLSAVSLLLVISGVILYLFGLEFMKKIRFPILFLLLMIPLPFVDTVAPPAQTISAVASSNLANLIGMPVHRDGLELHLSTGTFEVGLACSGLNSIISLFTIGVVFAFIIEGGLFMKSIIILLSIPLALAGNIIRITSVLAVASIYGQEAAIKYFHDFSSLLLFSVALSGLFLAGRCFGRLRFKKIF